MTAKARLKVYHKNGWYELNLLVEQINNLSSYKQQTVLMIYKGPGKTTYIVSASFCYRNGLFGKLS